MTCVAALIGFALGYWIRPRFERKWKDWNYEHDPY